MFYSAQAGSACGVVFRGAPSRNMLMSCQERQHNSPVGSLNTPQSLLVQRQSNGLKNGSIKALELKRWTVMGGGRAPSWYHCFFRWSNSEDLEAADAVRNILGETSLFQFSHAEQLWMTYRGSDLSRSGSGAPQAPAVCQINSKCGALHFHATHLWAALMDY